MSGAHIRVLVVDDHPLVRRGVALLLRGEPGMEIVGEEADGPAAVAAVDRLAPDVVLMDARMPGGDGVDATRRIVGRGGAAVLMLTTYHADDEVQAALRAGASGYVLKDAAPDELVRAVRAVAAGAGWLDPVVIRPLLVDLAARADPVPEQACDLARLTPREREVLALVAHGLTNRQLMEHLVVSEATVKTHVNRLLGKLGCETRAQLVGVAFHAGVVSPGSQPEQPVLSAPPCRARGSAGRRAPGSPRG
jgi:DNA-binding NarL/FixJ family response regulator